VKQSLVRAARRLRRRRSARDATYDNSRRGYERLWGTPALLEEYLDPSRLAFYDEVAEACRGLGARSVVDVGCGGGDLLVRVAALLGPERVAGIDTARSAVARARQLLPEGRFVVGDATRLDLGERFELVLCTEVLEHVRDPGALLDALERLRAPGGAIVVTVPDGAIDDYEGHVSFWTEEQLAELLRPRGLRSIVRVGAPEPCPGLLATLAPGP
jgi:2-polyprenyl-3-methyl-5-hydroxy-6-metoxy-1,4-benzoquinol methylase